MLISGVIDSVLFPSAVCRASWCVRSCDVAILVQCLYLFSPELRNLRVLLRLNYFRTSDCIFLRSCPTSPCLGLADLFFICALGFVNKIYYYYYIIIMIITSLAWRGRCLAWSSEVYGPRCAPCKAQVVLHWKLFIATIVLLKLFRMSGATDPAASD